MGAPLKLKPTATGRKILDICIERHGSIQAAARAADVSEHTLRRRIYSNPSRIDLATSRALVRIGIPESLLSA